jgi:IclR family KDG regulon transcriptional repressor
VSFGIDTPPSSPVADAVPGGQTADRALEILEVAVSGRGPLSLPELADGAGVNTGVARRLVRVLVKHSLLARHADGRRYEVGTGMIALAAAVAGRVSVREIALPAMTRMADLSSETVSLHVRHLRMRTCVATVEGRHPVRRVVRVGEALPLYAGLAGRTILAFLTPEEIRAVLEDARAAGIASRGIEASLTRARQQGYLAELGEADPAVAALVVPIFDASGVVASMMVSGPSARFSLDVAAAVTGPLTDEAAQVSAVLGAELPGALPRPESLVRVTANPRPANPQPAHPQPANLLPENPEPPAA